MRGVEPELVLHDRATEPDAFVVARLDLWRRRDPAGAKLVVEIVALEGPGCAVDQAATRKLIAAVLGSDVDLHAAGVGFRAVPASLNRRFRDGHLVDVVGAVARCTRS